MQLEEERTMMTREVGVFKVSLRVRHLLTIRSRKPFSPLT